MADWKPFFSTIAQVDITAIAVLFAVFQIRQTSWRTSSSGTLKRLAAWKALLELFVPMLVALIALTYDSSWQVGALIAGAAGEVLVLTYWVAYCAASESPDRFDKVQFVGTTISFLFYLAIFRCGQVGAEEASLSLSIVAGISIWLIISAFIEAWWLLDWHT